MTSPITSGRAADIFIFLIRICINQDASRYESRVRSIRLLLPLLSKGRSKPPMKQKANTRTGSIHPAKPPSKLPTFTAGEANKLCSEVCGTTWSSKSFSEIPDSHARRLPVDTASLIYGPPFEPQSGRGAKPRYTVGCAVFQNLVRSLGALDTSRNNSRQPYPSVDLSSKQGIAW